MHDVEADTNMRAEAEAAATYQPHTNRNLHADKDTLTVDGKSYALRDIKLVSIAPAYKRLYTKYEGYNVYLRRTRGADLVGTFPNKAQAEQVAEDIARTLATHKTPVATTPSSGAVGNAGTAESCDDVILAGNSMRVEGNRLTSGSHTYSLDDVHRASRSIRVPEGYIVLQFFAVAVPLLLFIGIVGLSFLLGINYPTLRGFLIIIAFIIFTGWLVMSFLYLTSKLPPVFAIILHSSSGVKCVYKSENMAQVDVSINQINSALKNRR